MKVLAAMSGGVDSAVAAARAIEAGHDVTGVHLALSKNPRPIGRVPVAAAPRKMRTMLGGPPTYSESRSMYGIYRIASPRTWSATSSQTTQPVVPRTPACAVTRRSSSQPSWTAASRSASMRSAPATTPD